MTGSATEVYGFFRQLGRVALALVITGFAPAGVQAQTPDNAAPSVTSAPEAAPAGNTQPPVGAPRQLVPNLPGASVGETSNRVIGPEGTIAVPSPGVTPGVETLGQTEASSGVIDLPESERNVGIDGRASVATVVAEELIGLDSEVIGLDPAPGETSLDREMFGRATRNDLRDLLAALPTAGPTPAMRRLMRTVLVTATLPLPGGPGREPGEATLLGLRLSKLAQLGYGDDLQTLADRFPALFDDPFAVAAWADGLILLDRLTPVCAHSEALLGTPTAAEPYWQQVQILCDLSTGRTERAGLILEVLQDQGTGDPRFVALAQGLIFPDSPPAEEDAATPTDAASETATTADASGEGPAEDEMAGDDGTGEREAPEDAPDSDGGVVPLPEPTPPEPAPLPPMPLPAAATTVAMHLLAEAPLPMAISRDGTPAMMEAVAYAEASPAPLRLIAAEAATAAGLMSPFTLNQFQLSVPIPAAILEDPMAYAAGRDSALSRAALMQGALEAQYATPGPDEPETAPQERALTMRHYAVLRAVASRQPLPVVAGLLQGLSPSPEHLPIAEAAAATFYALDDPALAEGWIALLEEVVAATMAPVDATPPEATEPAQASDGTASSTDAGATDAGATDAGATDTESIDAAASALPLGIGPGVLDRLWPLRFLATADAPGQLSDMGYAAGLNAWLAALLEADGTEAANYGAAVTLAALDALGHEVDAAVWSRLALDDVRTAVQLPPAPLWWRLPRAAAADQAGLAALMAVIVLGDDGVAAVHPVVIAHVVEALTVAGLAEEARGIALEAVWAALP